MERQQRLELSRCLARLADGDRAAFRPVFDLAWPEVRELARRLLRHAADADDAAQTALVKLFERAHEYDPARDGLVWIAGIVSWECMTLRRRQGRRREAGAAVAERALAAVADGARSPEEQAIAGELEAAAVAVLGELRAEDRAALRRALFDEPHGDGDGDGDGNVGSDRNGSGSDGGRAVKPATLRKRLERALTRLRAAWRDHGIG